MKNTHNRQALSSMTSTNGFQLEASQICDAKALTRLCLVVALATLLLVSQATEVVNKGRRRWADPHWFRGLSYLKIGWQWVKQALHQEHRLIRRFALSPAPDSELVRPFRNYRPPSVIALQFCERFKIFPLLLDNQVNV